MNDYELKNNIIENIKRVEHKINEACIRSGRKRDDVTLIAVSKTKPYSYIDMANSFGIIDFGENKAQELVIKYDENPRLNWHFIGHLQTNKVKNVIDKTYLIHSVDSYRLAEFISKEAIKRDKVVDILLELNIANEESKFGFSEKSLKECIVNIDELKGINVRGLMTVAPFVDDSEENREVFASMKDLLLDISPIMKHNRNMNVLSMGMSNDYEVAIECGATMIRVGTDIFGSRKYN